MSGLASDLRNIVAAARPLVEQWLDLAEQFAELRDAAKEKGLDWSQIKALLKAQIQDDRDGGEGKRVARIIERADFASSYAAMLGLLPGNMNNKNFSVAETSFDRPIDTPAGRHAPPGARQGKPGNPSHAKADDEAAAVRHADAEGDSASRPSAGGGAGALNPQSPSNRGANAGGEAWQDGTPQGHRPSAASETTGRYPGAGAELAGHEGHIAKGEGDPCRKRATTSPTIPDDEEIPTFLRAGHPDNAWAKRKVFFGGVH